MFVEYSVGDGLRASWWEEQHGSPTRNWICCVAYTRD